MSISTSTLTTPRTSKRRRFESWYENPIDLPGRWYLQVITQIFKENRLAKGEFIGLGRKLNLRNITCPAYLLAGATDDITTPEQVLDAAKYLGTPKECVVQKTVPGGHIGLFMGARTLREHLAANSPVDRCLVSVGYPKAWGRRGFGVRLAGPGSVGLRSCRHAGLLASCKPTWLRLSRRCVNITIGPVTGARSGHNIPS